MYKIYKINKGRRSMERFIKQNVCKFKLRVNSIMEVQGEGGGDLKPRCPERGKVEYL